MAYHDAGVFSCVDEHSGGWKVMVMVMVRFVCAEISVTSLVVGGGARAGFA